MFLFLYQEDSKQVIMHSVTAVIVERHHLSLSWLELPITYLLSRASVSSNGLLLLVVYVVIMGVIVEFFRLQDGFESCLRRIVKAGSHFGSCWAACGYCCVVT